MIGVLSSWETFATQVAAGLLQVLQLGAHAVERRRELSDLVARARVDALGVVAGLHPLRRRRHVAERLGHAAREPAGDDERDAGGQRAGQRGTATRSRSGTGTSRVMRAEQRLRPAPRRTA